MKRIYLKPFLKVLNRVFPIADRRKTPMRRVDLTPALRNLDQTDLHAGSRRILAVLNGLEANVQAVEITVLKDRASVLAITEDQAEALGEDWPVMEAFGAILFLVNQARAPEARTVSPGMGELGFVIERNSGLLPSDMAALRCTCGLYPPPDMFAVLQILRGSSLSGHMSGKPSGGRFEAQNERRHIGGEPS